MERDRFQNGLFNILFKPLTLNNLNNPRDALRIRENAELIAEKFLTGELDLDEDWEFENDDLFEVKALSFQWLKYARKFYSDIISNPNNQENEFNLLKFVWHKKQQELEGWGPKLVLAAHNSEEETTTIHYVTRKMDAENALNVADVGTMFNLFQPPQQEKPHKVNVRLTDHATIFTTQMESGRTLDEHFQKLNERFTENENDVMSHIDQIFEQTINLYLQPTIEYKANESLTELPSLGWVEPCEYEWKFLKFQDGSMEFDFSGEILFKQLLNHEQQIPFLIPIRWASTSTSIDLQPISILHGDEWGGNFICPTSITGSLRPIDFEDAHVQFLNDDFMIGETSYCRVVQSLNAHFNAGGKLAYRTQDTPTNPELPLHRYCAFSALGRLLCSLIQRQSQTISSGNRSRWIELTVSRFFCVLENRIETAINEISVPSGDGSFCVEEIHKGLIFRTILSALNWSEYWKSKPGTEQSEDFIGKWRKDWLDCFQEQLRTEGLWQHMDKDQKGRPSGQSSYYSSILKSHMNSELNESQKEDFQNATEFVEEHWYDPRITQGFPQVIELIDLFEDVNWQEDYSSLSDLEMGITFINILHQIGSHNLILEREEDANNMSKFLIELLSRQSMRQGILDSGYYEHPYWFIFTEIHEIRIALEEIMPIEEINPRKFTNCETQYGYYGRMQSIVMQIGGWVPTERILILLVELEALSRRIKLGDIDNSRIYQCINACTRVWMMNIASQRLVIDDVEERNGLISVLIEAPPLDLEKHKIQEPLWLLDKIFSAIYQEFYFITNNPDDEHYLSDDVIKTIGTAMCAFFQIYHQQKSWRNKQERIEMAQKRISEILTTLEILVPIRSEWRNVIVDVWNQNHKVWEKRKYIQNEVWAAQWRELFFTFNG